MTEKASQLKKLLKQKESHAFYSKRLNVSIEEVKSLLSELKSTEAETANYISELEERVIEVSNDKGTWKSTVITDFEPKNDEELIVAHKVNTEKYILSKYYSKLLPSGKFTSTLFCSLKKSTDFSLEDFSTFLKDFVPKYKHLQILKVQGPKGETEWVDIEISLADFHLDKLDVDIESIEYKVEMYLKVLENLLVTCGRAYLIRKVVFVIGNDLFQTDNIQGGTTSTTMVDHSITWNKAYEIGFSLMVDAISLIKQHIKKVDIVLVQGNHARTKEYYLAHALDVYFSKDNNITFDREFTTVKHVKLGDTFIGYHHGNTKIDDLPLLFATNPSSCGDFGSSKYREVHTGDKHHYLAKEIKGVRVQQSPSLSGTDQWHLDGNFVNSTRAGLAIVYHPTKGRVAEFEERI